MPRRQRIAATVTSILVCIGGLWVPALAPVTPTVMAVEVIGDDELDQYSGSGAVILPSGIQTSSRQQAATCVGCRWKVTLPCLRDDEHPDAACRGVTLGCPQGREIKRAWVALPGRDFEPVGLFCPSDGEATSVVDVTRQVRSGFTHRLPPLQPACEPPRGMVVGIPLHCRSGQPSAHAQWSDTVAGYTVTTRARARWDWSFASAGGAQRVVRSDSPGRPYPEAGVRHTFRTTGIHRAQVRTTWQAEFHIDGLGPFPVSPDLTQQAQIELPTGSALGVVRP